jgi:hypothetical protein
VAQMQKVKKERKHLHQAMDNTIYETQAALANLEIKNAKLADDFFNEKKRDFLRFLRMLTNRH